MDKRLMTAFAVAAAASMGWAVRAAGQRPAPRPTEPGSPKPAQRAKAWAPPRTPWGDPDLQGTYTSDNSIGVPFERPAQYAGRAELTDEELAARKRANAEQIARDNNPRPESAFAQDTAANNAPRHWLERASRPSRATSMVVDPADGRVPPMTPAAQRRVAERRGAGLAHGESDSYEYHSNYDRCISRGVTSSIMPAIYGNGTDITQGPGFVIIRNEMIREVRVIPLDGRPHAGRNIRTYMGDSRGRWDGTTLVVETTHFSDRTAISGGAIPTDTMRLVERLTPVDPGTLRYAFTVEDPASFARPFTVAFDLTSKPGYQLYEYACHEGNYGMANMLSAARADEKKP